MITDEQALNLIKMLPFPELSINEAKAVLENYEKSKWIKFDPKNEDTWPEAEDFVLILQENCTNSFEARFYPDGFLEPYEGFFIGSMKLKFKNVTHWQPLPDKWIEK